MTDKLYLSWEDFHAHCRSLAELIRQSGKKYTRILAVSRGGLLPAGILAYELDIRDCEAVNMSGYDAGGRRRDDGAVELRADKAARKPALPLCMSKLPEKAPLTCLLKNCLTAGWFFPGTLTDSQPARAAAAAHPQNRLFREKPAGVACHK